jgi:hypothetical protein
MIMSPESMILSTADLKTSKSENPEGETASARTQGALPFKIKHIFA